MPEAAVTQNLLDHRPLRRLDEGDDLHRAATLRTSQRIDLVNPFDEHGPSLTATAGGRLGMAARAVQGDSPIFAETKIGTVPGGFRRLAAHAARLVRVPAVIADQMAPFAGMCCVNSARNPTAAGSGNCASGQRPIRPRPATSSTPRNPHQWRGLDVEWPAIVGPATSI